MRVIISSTISADGYLNDMKKGRLMLSSPEDWKAIYALRAECDAILVGAGTLRADNPSLVIRDEALRKKRVAEGRPADITKVAISGSGNLDPKLNFFTEGDGEKILFTKGKVSGELSEVATVISRKELNSIVVLVQLRKMGINTLMIEGGSKVLSMFLRERTWDEFRLGVSPIFVGDHRAPRLVLDGDYPPMTLVKSEKLGQTSVMHFESRSQFRRDSVFMANALYCSLHSEQNNARYRVGAVIVTADGQTFEGYTGETAPANHAEEEAIAKALAAGAILRGATIYSTIEPCTVRASKAVSCTDMIIGHGFARVVFGLREPARFAKCDSIRRLSDAGIEVTEMPGFAPEIRNINSHLE